jgi:hypothetical protein
MMHRFQTAVGGSLLDIGTYKTELKHIIFSESSL